MRLKEIRETHTPKFRVFPCHIFYKNSKFDIYLPLSTFCLLSNAASQDMPHPKANAILAQLFSDEFMALMPHTLLVSLQKGQVLFEPGGAIDHCYFPLNCTLELAVDLPDGHSGPTAVINMNGVYPLHLIDQSQSLHRATVRSAGLCYRIPAWVVREELQRNPRFLWLLLKEAVQLFEQASMETACLRHHSLEQITAKLILLSLDSSDSKVVSLTQQEMANSLGVRREGVTMAIQKFKQQHIVTTHRGGLTVVDRPGLERHACDCYKTLQKMNTTQTHAAFGKRMKYG
ncbi:MAG: hypothetical protein RL758_582 [Pseudomonadota bacterium]